MILLMGNEDDPQIIAIADALKTQGHSFLIFDTSLYPTQVNISYRPTEASMELQIGEHRLAQNDIHSLYWRTLIPTQATQENPIALRDSASLLKSFLHLLGNKSKNTAEAVNFNQEKPRQLAQVAQL